MKKQGRNLQNNYEKKFKSIIYFYNLIDNGQHSNTTCKCVNDRYL